MYVCIYIYIYIHIYAYINKCTCIQVNTHTRTHNVAGAGTPGGEKSETRALEHLDKLGDKMEKKIEKMFGVGKGATEPDLVDPLECMLPRDARLIDQTLVALCIRLKNLEWAKKQTQSLEHDLNLLWQKVNSPFLLFAYAYMRSLASMT